MTKSNSNRIHLFQEPEIIQPEETPVATNDEDISNDAYAQRHERALVEERKKFTTFLKFPYSTRSRANRRIDSQSSGANTPDPMSPAPSTPAAATTIDPEVRNRSNKIYLTSNFI